MTRWEPPGVIVRAVGVVELLSQLPEAIVQPPRRVWNVFARSLGEQGADGRTALAWRWALTGACPSPVTLTAPLGRSPDHGELIAEAEARAELAGCRDDPGGQVMHARYVLLWLAGRLEALPLWNAGPAWPQVTEGAEHARSPAEIEEVYFWAVLARDRHPWPGDAAPAGAWLACGWAYGVVQLLNWVCGVTGEGPLTGVRATGRPTLYQVSLDARRAMTGARQAREAGQPVVAGRMEAMMETFLWLAGWNPLPPVDRHGHVAFEDCPEREAACGCGAVGRCLGSECAACSRVACAEAFGAEDFPLSALGPGS